MSKNLVLYLSPKQSISVCLTWYTNTRNIPLEIKYVENIKDMAEIAFRNKENKLPVLKSDDVLLTSPIAILNYLKNFGMDSPKWPGLANKLDPLLEAKLQEGFSYYDSFLDSSVRDYLNNKQNCLFDGVEDDSLKEKLKVILLELDSNKRRHKFFTGNNFTLLDLINFSCIHRLENDPIFNEITSTTLFGWYRVCRKIFENNWEDETSCNEDYDFEPDGDDYMVAETIMEAVRENRPDLLEKLAKEGFNINMPLAVVEAVNRNNLFVLKVMRDYNCFLKWPMAVSQALRLSKPEDILALLIDPNMSKEDLIKEANLILKQEEEKMKEVLGPEYEEYKKQKEAQKPEVEQVRNNTIMEGVHATSRYVFFNGQKAPYSMDFLRAFKTDDEVYKSVVEYILCQKAKHTLNEELYDKIKNSNNLNEQLELGYSIQVDEEWEKQEELLVKKATKEKFTQHKDLQHVLLQVGDRILAKTGKEDTYWGIGLDTMNLDSQKQEKWAGENKLGNILMDVKKEIEQELNFKLANQASTQSVSQQST